MRLKVEEYYSSYILRDTQDDSVLGKAEYLQSS